MQCRYSLPAGRSFAIMLSVTRWYSLIVAVCFLLSRIYCKDDKCGCGVLSANCICCKSCDPSKNQPCDGTATTAKCTGEPVFCYTQIQQSGKKEMVFKKGCLRKSYPPFGSDAKSAEFHVLNEDKTTGVTVIKRTKWLVCRDKHECNSSFPLKSNTFLFIVLFIVFSMRVGTY